MDPQHIEATLLNLSSDAIMVSDLNGCITYWNDGAAAMYGWPRAEALGRVVRRLLPPVDPGILDTAEKMLMANGRWEGEIERFRRDGNHVLATCRWVIAEASILQIEAGISGLHLHFAHQMSQPLTAVLAEAEAGLCWLDARLPNLEEARASFNRILRSGTRAADLLHRKVRAAAR